MCRSKLDLYCGQVKLWTDLIFMYICEKVVNQSAPYQKRISSTSVIFWSAMQFSVLVGIVFYRFNPQYKLVLLLEKYLFLCRDPRGYFVLWFLKIIIATYTLLKITLTAGIPMEKMRLVLLFSFQTVFLRQSLASVAAALVLFRTELSWHAVLC